MIFIGRRDDFLLLLLVISSCTIVACSADDIIDRINAKIVEISGQDDPTGAQDAIIFESIKQMGSGELTSEDDSILKEFLNLQKLSAQLCNSEGYKIVKENLANMPSHTTDPQVIEYFVYRYVKKYARDCKTIWPQGYAETHANHPEAGLVNDKLMLVRAIFTAIEENNRIDKNAIMLGKFKQMRANDITGEANYRIVWNYLVFCTHADPNWPSLYGQMDPERGSVTVDGRRIRRLFERHLYIPCRTFMSLYGNNVFAPATLLLSFMKGDGRYNYNNHVSGDFIIAWRDYRLCGSLINRADKIVAGVEEIARNTLP